MKICYVKTIFAGDVAHNRARQQHHHNLRRAGL